MMDEPRVGSRRPRIMRMVVVLPAPLRPMKAKTLPRGTLKETRSTAHWWPKYRVSRWAWITESRRLVDGLDSGRSVRVMLYLPRVWVGGPYRIAFRPRPGGS